MVNVDTFLGPTGVPITVLINKLYLCFKFFAFSNFLSSSFIKMIDLIFFVTLSLGPVHSVTNTHLLFVLNQFLLKPVIPKVKNSLLWVIAWFMSRDDCLRHNGVSAKVSKYYEKKEKNWRKGRLGKTWILCWFKEVLSWLLSGLILNFFCFKFAIHVNLLHFCHP